MKKPSSRYMPRKSVLGRSIAMLFLVVAVSAVAISPTSAITSNKNLIVDNFGEIRTPQDPLPPGSYWWRTVEGLVDGQFVILENEDCLPNGEACVTIENEDGRDFARMSNYPEAVTGVYSLAEISEERDGYTYGEEHRWLPAVGDPVELTTRFRLSENYEADGSGGAVGSNGVWLWNAPIVHEPEFRIEPQQAIGFNWSDIDTFGGYYAGFKANVINRTFPPQYRLDLYDVDVNDWVDVKIVWSVNEAGVQSVDFYINHVLRGSYDLPEALPSLTIEMWNDNQVAQLTGDGGFYVDFQNPPSPQHFDVDFIKVK